MSRRRILLLITLAACGSRECRLDPSPSCSYRPERGVSDGGGASTFGDELVSIDAGDVHVCALLSTGDDTFGGEEVRARCWGGNPHQQLARVASPEPGELWWYDGWDDPSFLAVGAAHACLVDPDADTGMDEGPTLRCWGNDDAGQHGVDPEDSGEGITESQLNASGEAEQPFGMVLGGLHGCIPGATGVRCFGDHRWGQLGRPDAECCAPDFVNGGDWGGRPFDRLELSAGSRHTCAVAREGDAPGPMRCWGHAGFGQLGPLAGSDPVVPIPTPMGLEVRMVAAGPHHTCVVVADRSVECFGRNERGELGSGDTVGRAEPMTVALPAPAAAVFAGGESGLAFGGDLDVVTPGAAHTCALDDEGRAWCWGDNSAGQLGLAPGEPELVPVPTHPSLRFRALALGGRFTCGITTDEALLCWGDNGLGQLGRAGESSHEPSEVPIFRERFVSP